MKLSMGPMQGQWLKRISLIIAVCTLIQPNLWARKFTSQYCEFELPSGWDCALEGTEWVCQSSNKDRKKEAIIILAAKIRGSQDSLTQYQSYLNKAKTFTLPGGKTQVSEAKYTKLNDVNNQKWVDSLHMASEVPGFYTRYMATVKEDLGIAVTFSVAKDHYSAYQDLFESIISTLKVFRQKNTKATDFKLANTKNGDLLDGPIIPDSARAFDIGGDPRKRKKSSGSGEGDLILYGLLAAAVVFGITRLKKKKGAQSKKKKKKVKKKVKKKK
ncbi:MAG: hypothetical protein CME63_06830 [Halobacteriovoraceae bacterium]|nr:hypothetical protein [Halobacteriovoraceae bacterium]MBC97445.1 hypothetical protein [Halobacteriovoraceae bacterium]